MSYWWVNHKQTFKAEVSGGYIWSPQTNKDGSYNQSYENMKLCKPNDKIFSYANGAIKAVGIITNSYTNETRPLEFGSRSKLWENNGYKVIVQWVTLNQAVVPKENIKLLSPLLPKKYSPLQSNGNGNQKIYLASISKELWDFLYSEILEKNSYFEIQITEQTNAILEDKEEKQILTSSRSGFNKQQLVNARVGQGIFRENVLKIEKQCRVCMVSDNRFLIASHIKPWRLSNDKEKVDGQNGLLLSPHIDKLFDKGYLSFSDNGDLLFKDNDIFALIKKWGITTENVGPFSKEQIRYLEFHRKLYGFE